MNLGDLGRLVRRNAKEHSPVILSVTAGLGTLVTAYLAAKAAYKARDVIKNFEDEGNPYEPPRIFSESDRPVVYRTGILIEKTQLVWKLYIPTAVSATTTIVCIIGANRVEVKRTLAAQTAFTVAQRAFDQYREKVIDEIGPGKDQSIRDQIARERVLSSPPPSQEVLVTGPGNVLCCELFTKRYFTSDMETLRKAQNDLNHKLISQDYATFDDFYYMVGLPQTSSSGHLGWKSAKILVLEFTTLMTEDGRPCLAFDYNYFEPI